MYIRIEEVAEFLHVSVRTIYSYVEDGVIPAPYKLRGRVLFSRSEVEQAVRDARNAQSATSRPGQRRRGRPRKHPGGLSLR